MGNCSHDCDVILSHIWDRLKLDSMEWRKIFKALQLLEIIMKVGDPQCFSSIKGNIYKIKSFQSFTTSAGTGKSSGIREKAKNICELLEDPDRLEEEREKTREVRNKLSGGSYSSGGKYGGISNKGYRSEYHHSEYKPRKEKPYEERTKKTESRRKEKPKNEDLSLIHISEPTRPY
eukprot:TRINITY_DN1041_c0_g1_i6.p2 TRINITY_DN1041_c0_g1~~TRINITY_DN1041_c0_g1_i6.p2  ORF type:complete len:176 (-),score=70.27 TRINITY_DN1041_c0_g1_i6:48-575(-)